MSEPQSERESDIQIMAETLNQIYQGRDELQTTLQEVKDLSRTFQHHVEAVASRHKKQFEGLADLAKILAGLAETVQRNTTRIALLEAYIVETTTERERWSEELRALHGTMRGWYRSMEAVLTQLGMENVIEPLPAETLEAFPPPASLPSHYYRRKAS